MNREKDPIPINIRTVPEVLKGTSKHFPLIHREFATPEQYANHRLNGWEVYAIRG
jgi:hypothetical protein